MHRTRVPSATLESFPGASPYQCDTWYPWWLGRRTDSQSSIQNQIRSLSIYSAKSLHNYPSKAPGVERNGQTERRARRWRWIEKERTSQLRGEGKRKTRPISPKFEHSKSLISPKTTKFCGEIWNHLPTGKPTCNEEKLKKLWLFFVTSLTIFVRKLTSSFTRSWVALVCLFHSLVPARHCYWVYSSLCLIILLTVF